MIDVEVDYPLGVTILKKKFSKIIPGRLQQRRRGTNLVATSCSYKTAKFHYVYHLYLCFFFVPDDTMKSHSVLTSPQRLYCKTVILQWVNNILYSCCCATYGCNTWHAPWENFDLRCSEMLCSGHVFACGKTRGLGSDAQI